MKTTDMEKDVIRAIAENEYSDTPEDNVWVWVIADNCKITRKDQVSGIVSSLVKKDLVLTDGETIQLTEKGVIEYYKIKEG